MQEATNLISAIAQLIIAIGVIWGYFKTKNAVANVAEKVEEVHKATNSMKDELVAVTAKSAKAEGVKEEKDRRDATD